MAKREPLYVVEIKTGTRPVRWEPCSSKMPKASAEMYARLWMRENPQWTYRAAVASDAD